MARKHEILNWNLRFHIIPVSQYTMIELKSLVLGEVGSGAGVSTGLLNLI